jgi:hypothetical protein
MAIKKPIPIPIPVQEVEVIDRIYDAIEKKSRRQLRLSRLGASGIGDECIRKIWLSWRAYDTSKFGGRMLRLFETGELQEKRIIADLRLAGFGVWDTYESGLQYAYTDDTGHFIVKLDGVVKGIPGAEETPHILEVKTHNTKSFTELEKKGVQGSKPAHYYQVQAGMLMTGIDRGFYVALNKDTEQYYVRRIKPDEAVQEDILKRIKTLVEAELAPARIGEDPENYPCRWCDYKDVCYNNKSPIKTCRSCEHAKPFENGTWLCTLKSSTLSLDDQLAACESYAQKGR